MTDNDGARSQARLTAAEPQWPDAPRPPAGAPNVIAIVLDDIGFAQLGAYGSDIATPNMDRLAAGGLRYNKFHVTALCSPTRAAFLTGRNHHAVGMGFLADIPLAYPGYNARLARTAAPLPRVLRDIGYSTFALGKWHLTPRFERSAAGPFTSWPLGLGFERYYGFLQGDTNHWVPNLVQDNHYIDPPARPEDGYHLSEDLAATAIRYVLDQQRPRSDCDGRQQVRSSRCSPRGTARRLIVTRHSLREGGRLSIYVCVALIICDRVRSYSAWSRIRHTPPPMARTPRAGNATSPILGLTSRRAGLPRSMPSRIAREVST